MESAYVRHDFTELDEVPSRRVTDLADRFRGISHANEVDDGIDECAIVRGKGRIDGRSDRNEHLLLEPEIQFPADFQTAFPLEFQECAPQRLARRAERPFTICGAG